MPDKSLNPRKAPRQSRSRERVGKIMTAAHDLLMDQGLAAVTTSKVARMAEVPVGSVYQYFPNRDAILMALGQQVVEEEDAVIESALDDSRTLESLEQVVETVLDVFAQMAFRIQDRTEFDHALARFPEWLEYRQQSWQRIAMVIANHPEAVRKVPDPAERQRVSFVIVTITLGIMQLAQEGKSDAEKALWLAEAKRAVLGYMSTLSVG